MERVDSKFCEGCAGALTAKNIELDEMRAALASKEAEIEALAQRCAGMQKDRERLDWLERSATGSHDAAWAFPVTDPNDGSWWLYGCRGNDDYELEGSNLRSVIDAAIESERDAGSDNGVEIGPRVEAKP